MRLLEYQGKEILSKHGVNVPQSVLLNNEKDLNCAIEELGLPLVLKSQVLSGGRGKAGLIKLVQSKEEAHDCFSLLRDERNIELILAEEAINIESELYLSVTLDPLTGQAIIMASKEGGVDIESLALRRSDSIIREYVDIVQGLMPYQINHFVFQLGLDSAIARQFSNLIRRLYDIFIANDAEMVEINPVFLTKQGELVAGDCKLSIDDNSLFRQNSPATEIKREDFQTEAEYNATIEGIPYFRFDGDIGLMCAGAGLTNTVYDLVNYEGGKVNCYVEFGGPNYHKAVKAMELCLDNQPKVILIVTFGTIARADVMAEGIAEAVRVLKVNCPIVTCLRGTGEEVARQIVSDVGLISLSDTEDAVRKAISLVSEGSK